MLKYLESKKVKEIILGCTELPIAFENLNIKGNFIDPTLILAKVQFTLLALKMYLKRGRAQRSCFPIV